MNFEDRVEASRSPSGPELIGGGVEPLQRKQVSVIFADLSGFTAMSERLDPEEVREILCACFRELVDVIESHKGTVEKYIGDCIVAIYGAPLAQEDHAAKALRTSLELLTRLDEFNRSRNLELGLHIGVNSGLVVAGEIRAGSTRQYAVTGDTVNLAARLEGKSSTGEILVGPETFRLTEHLFRFGPPVPLSLKGKAHPVPARLVLGQAEAPREALAALHGRQETLQTLRRKATTPGLVEVYGPSGIGKTFLAQHLANDLADAVMVQTDPGQAGEPYSSLRQILDSFLPGGLNELSTLIENRSLDLNREHLAPVLGRPIPGRVEPGSAQTLVRMAVTRLFIGLAEAEFTTLMIDDGQWLDPSSRELLAHLSRQELCRGFLFSRWSVASEFETYLLGPMEGPEVEDYLSALLPEADSKVVKQLAKRSAGHPLFARELARQSHQTKDLSSLPGSLQAAVMARVDALDEEARQVLEVASVLGPECSKQELGELCPHYEKGLDSEFLVPLDEQRLGFQHKLAQEAVYQSLSLRRRRGLHQTIAELLERRGASESRLAYHFTAAEDWERAGYHLQRVADHAVSLAADRESLESFERTLEIRKKSGNRGADEFELLQTERQLGEVKLRRGELSAASAHLEKAADMVGFSVPRGRWAVRARLLRSLGGWMTGLRSDHYPTESRRQRELFKILKALCFAEVSQPESFMLYSIEHLRAAKACSDHDGIAIAQAGFGMAFDFAGLPLLANRFHRRALSTSKRCLQSLTHAMVSLGAGCHFALVGKSIDARAHLQEAVARSRQSGDLKTWSTALVELASLETFAGDIESAVKYGRELHEIGRSSGDRQCMAWGDLILGRTAHYLENLDEAANRLSKACEILREADDFFSLALAQSYLVLTLLAREDVVAAESVLLEGEQSAREKELRGHLVGWLTLARASFEICRNSSSALAASEKASKGTHHTLGGPSHALRLRAKALWRAGQKQRAEKFWRRAERAALDRGELLSAAQVRLEKGRETGQGPSYANLLEALDELTVAR